MLIFFELCHEAKSYIKHEVDKHSLYENIDSSVINDASKLPSIEAAKKEDFFMMFLG